MRKILLSALVALLLVGCSNNNEEKKISPETMFKDEINEVLSIESTSKKYLMKNMNNEAVVAVVDKMLENESLMEVYTSYGVESQGIGTDHNGNKLFCYKYPVNFSFDGGETEINEFIEELNNIPSKIAVSEFEITENEEDFHIEALVNFYGDLDSAMISGSKGAVNFKKNDVEVNEGTKITLRDFDVNLTIRPSNSDSSAIVFGVKNSNKCVFSDENIEHSLNVDFSSENGKVVVEYSLDGGESIKEAFSPSGDIKFDILSCEKVVDKDYIKADLVINNSSEKKVSVMIYDDLDGRVNVVSKSGNVTIVNK